MTQIQTEKLGIKEYLELRRLVDVLYDVQDVRMRTANRLRLMPKETLQIHVKPLRKVEETLTKDIERFLAKIPIYTDFLYNVKGVGPRISGSIIAQTMIRFEKVSKEEYDKLSQCLDETHRNVASPVSRETHSHPASQEADDTPFSFAYSKKQLDLAQKTENGAYLIPVIRGIQAFDTVSKYWAWWGLHTVNGRAAKRKRGENINWNPKMRTLAWKIGKQFVMQGERYRMYYDREKMRLSAIRLPIGVCHLYEECKAKLKKRSKPACKGHIDAMAKRKSVKIFLSHLWETWRKMEGLPTPEPYAIAKLGHTTKEEPH